LNYINDDDNQKRRTLRQAYKKDVDFMIFAYKPSCWDVPLNNAFIVVVNKPNITIMRHQQVSCCDAELSA